MNVETLQSGDKRQLGELIRSSDENRKDKDDEARGESVMFIVCPSKCGKIVTVTASTPQVPPR